MGWALSAWAHASPKIPTLWPSAVAHPSQQRSARAQTSALSFTPMRSDEHSCMKTLNSQGDRFIMVAWGRLVLISTGAT